MVVRERRAEGRDDVLSSGAWRPPRDFEVVAFERMPVGRELVRAGSGWRPPRGVEVVAFERLPVGRTNYRNCDARGAARHGALGGSQRCAQAVGSKQLGRDMIG